MIILYHILISQIALSKGVNLHYTVGVNEFVKRQKKNTGKTYSLLTFDEIAQHAEEKLNNNNYQLAQLCHVCAPYKFSESFYHN